MDILEYKRKKELDKLEEDIKRAQRTIWIERRNANYRRLKKRWERDNEGLED